MSQSKLKQGDFILDHNGSVIYLLLEDGRKVKHYETFESAFGFRIFANDCGELTFDLSIMIKVQDGFWKDP